MSTVSTTSIHILVPRSEHLSSHGLKLHNMSELEYLRTQWKTLHTQTLPNLAKARDAAQTKWPVTLDHCFARIILDNTIGNGLKQWDKVIQKPATKNMSQEQLRNAIALGEDIKAGKADLRHLDAVSLRCRNKDQGKYGYHTATPSDTLEGDARSKRKRSSDTSNEPQVDSKKKIKVANRQSTLQFEPEIKSPEKTPGIENVWQTRTNIEDIKNTLDRIVSDPTLTPYRKKLYTTLLSVPKGRYTTYAAMSDYLNSSARAVGNGMRNNPFAPDVPCHRVLAANRTIGGFNGDWGKDGKYANKKTELLRSEGVMFDPSGKVVGEPFRKFHAFDDIQ